MIDWQGLILTLGCQNDLSEMLHLIGELLKIYLGRSVRDNM